ADNKKISADYPGAIARALEGRAVEVVGFAAGGVGSANPRGRDGDPERFAEPLLRALLRAETRARANAATDGALAGTEVQLPLPQPTYRLSREVMVLPALAESFLQAPRAPFAALSIGETVLVHLPGEISGVLTREVRADAALRGANLVLLPFNG